MAEVKKQPEVWRQVVVVVGQGQQMPEACLDAIHEVVVQQEEVYELAQEEEILQAKKQLHSMVLEVEVAVHVPV